MSGGLEPNDFRYTSKQQQLELLKETYCSTQKLIEIFYSAHSKQSCESKLIEHFLPQECVVKNAHYLRWELFPGQFHLMECMKLYDING